MTGNISLKAADYVVAVSLLLVPLGIGFYYAWKDSKNVNRNEYLFGGRQMSLIPVTLSFFVTFQSAISLIGVPVDIYLYGPMILMLYVGVCLSFVVGYFTLVPLMYPLKLSSIYEYFDLRYNSHAVRMFCTMIGMLQTFCYMIVALLAPALAMQAVVGIPLWMSVIIVGCIGTVYTGLGGIKSVVWTDAFQTVVVFIGLAALFIKAAMAVGGIDKLWQIAEDGGRTRMDVISPDPRTRHTWWSLGIGGCMMWLTNIFAQSSLQRVSGLKSVKEAKLSYMLNIPLHILYAVALGLIGIALYSYFYTLSCDPFEGGLITNYNQIVPFFMLHVLRDVPGMAGLYMATIFSGALSTLSSGINALATNTVEDILGGCLRSVSEKTATVVAKVLVYFYGFAIIGITYLCRSLKGNVTQLSATVFGACGSSVLGIFLLGCTIPWTNKYGALAGGITSIVLNLWIAVGGHLYGKATRHLQHVPSDQCESLYGNASLVTYLNHVSPTMNDVNSSTTLLPVTPLLLSEPLAAVVPDPYAYTTFFYDISYEWYSLTGSIICIIIGLIVSLLTRRFIDKKTEPKLIIPILRGFWFRDDKTLVEIEELSQKMMEDGN